MSFLRLISLALVVAVNLSCIREVDIPSSSHRIQFYLEGFDNSFVADTKAVVVTLPVLEQTGFYMSATSGMAGSETLLYSNVLFRKENGIWSGPAWWPQEEPQGGIHFYACNTEMDFSPGGGISVAADSGTDVVWSYIGTPDFGQTNTLTFHHPLSRLGKVNIVAENGYTLSGISVEITPNVEGNFLIPFDGSFRNIVSACNTVVANSAGVTVPDLYLLPGRYSLRFSWTATKGGVSETFTGRNGELFFEPGRITDISLVLAGQPNPIVSTTLQLFVDKTSVTHDWTGNGEPITVTSRNVTFSGFTPAPWRTMVKVGDDWVALADAVLNPSYSWLSGYPMGDSVPLVTSNTINTTVPRNTIVSHEEVLRSGSILSSDGQSVVNNSSSVNAVDLSYYDFTSRRMELSRYTANCYVVSSPGWYKFPLVYGNAIENDATNTASYNSSTAGLGHLNGFKNYKFDLDIAAPWIEDDWYAYLVNHNQVESVGIQWQKYSRWDSSSSSVVTESGSQGVIDNLSIISGCDGRYVLFHIDGNNIRPGNILITVKDAGGDSSDEEGESDALTIWSWHIWICGFPLEPVSVSNGIYDYSVLPANVGWVDGTKGLYHPRREATVRFESLTDPTVVSSEVTIVQQKGWETSVSGWGPYYQWGRKDPFVLGLFTFQGNYDVNMRGAIRHPERFNSERSTYALTQYYYDWLINNYDNLWDSNWNDYGVTSGSLPSSKTVMDPSPRRFCVAPDLAWDGFVTYGHDGAYADGYYFWTSSLMDGTVFFPGCGYIQYDGTTASGDNRYWTLHAWANAQRRASYSLKFDDTSVQTSFSNYNHRANGYPVRSVRYN